MVWELALNAACGTAAVAAGAHVNGNAIIKADLQVGALGGLLRAIILNIAAIFTAALDIGDIIFHIGIWGCTVGITAILSRIQLDRGIDVYHSSALERIGILTSLLQCRKNC